MLHEIIPLARPIISTDLETTGINPQTDRIIQIGICKLYPSGEYKEWTTLVNPGVPIPPEAMESHHITNEQVRAAPSFRDLHLKLAKAMEACDFLGYNLIHFDIPMLQAEFARCGYAWEFPQVVDGFRLWQRFYPRNLTAFIEEFALKDARGNPIASAVEEFKAFTAHDALHDARWTLRAMKGFFERCKEAPRTVKELSDMFLVTPRDNKSLDPDGKITWNENGEACISFGKKHPGKTLKLVATIDRGFLEWITRDNFSPAVKRIVSEALQGRFPTR
jgi:DNA polymerase III subunit epsilon